MKVTTEAERVIDLLADVAAAKGFETESYLTIAKADVRGLPKLEGTVAVNLALILKFMPAYLFQPEAFEPVPPRRDAADDDFLFHQGPARGLADVRFHSWRAPYAAAAHLPNVARFTEQADAFTRLLLTAAPDASQQADMDFTLALGELFTLIVYGQLILEQTSQAGVADDIVDTLFEVLVRDFSARAVELHGKTGSTEAQQEWALDAVCKPAVDAERFDRVWQQVAALSGSYTMTP
jgi:acyl-CoA dehydrogenase